MTANLTPLHPVRNAGTAPSPTNASRWGDGRRHPVATYVAEHSMRGLSAHTVEKMIYGSTNVFDRCAKVIDGFSALGDLAGLTRAMEPIDAALARVEHAAFCAALVEKDAQALANENVAARALLVAPSREHAVSFIRRSQAARTAALELEVAVARKWELAL